MQIVKTGNKRHAFLAVINTWLKDPRVYCNNCGNSFVNDGTLCCDTIHLGTNSDHCHNLIHEIKKMKQTMRNEMASNETKTMRWGVSLPPDLYETLNQYAKDNGDKSLFDDKKDLRWFIKSFPQFAMPKKV